MSATFENQIDKEYEDESHPPLKKSNDKRYLTLSSSSKDLIDNEDEFDIFQPLKKSATNSASYSVLKNKAEKDSFLTAASSIRSIEKSKN